MGKTALERLSSDEGQLFHLVIGHLLMLGLWICAAALTELMQRTLGAFSWPAYFLLNLVTGVVLVFLVIAKCDKAINKLVDLAERYIETPRRLQIGCVWIRRKIRAIESFVSAFFVAFIASAIAGGHVPALGLEEMENFARSSLTWITIYGLFLVLLVLASWLAGLFGRAFEGNIGQAIKEVSNEARQRLVPSRAEAIRWTSRRIREFRTQIREPSTCSTDWATRPISELSAPAPLRPQTPTECPILPTIARREQAPAAAPDSPCNGQLTMIGPSRPWAGDRPALIS